MPDLPEPTIVVIFSTSLLVGFSGALLPGPLLVVNIAQSARHGFWAGPAIVLGHVVLELSLAVLMYLGLSRLLNQPAVVRVVGVAGGGMLLFMGVSMMRNARHAQMVLDASPGTGASARLAIPLSGAVASLFNPGWVVWWATIGASYLLWSTGLGVVGLAAFYAGHILADLAWYSLVSGLVSSGRRWLRQEAYRGLLAACGLLILALGAFFLYLGGTGKLA